MAEQKTLKAGDTVEEGGLKLTIAQDGLSATMMIDPKSGPNWTVDRVMRFLDAHGLTCGIKPTALHGVFRNSTFGEPVVIAEGSPPTEGKFPTIKVFYDYVKIYKKLRNTQNEKTFARDAVQLFSINQEKAILRQIPGQSGEDGQNVFGDTLPAPDPKDDLIAPGKGTMLSANKLDLLAEREGVISYDGTTYRVVNANLHEGDVCPGEGEKNVDGTLVVLGSILSDAVVRAEGDIIIWGAVEAAEVRANGCVLIIGSVEGGRKGQIEAGGHIFLRSARHVQIIAGDGIYSFGPVVQSDLKAARLINSHGGNGRVLGGKLEAETQIRADEIGSKNEVGTVLVVGQELSELADHKTKIKAELDSKDEQLAKARSLATVLKEIKEKQGSLPPDKEQMLMTAVRTEWGMRGQAELLRRQVNDLERKLGRMRSADHSIRCPGTIWPGTEIRMSRINHRVDQPISNCAFVLKESRIDMLPLDEVETKPKLLARIHEDPEVE